MASLMRLVFLFFAVLAVLAGIAFGALNGHEVVLDLHFRTLALPLGAALLAFAFAGACAAGLLLWIGVIFPQRRRISALRRKLAGAELAGLKPAAAPAADAPPVSGQLPPP